MQALARLHSSKKMRALVYRSGESIGRGSLTNVGLINL